MGDSDLEHDAERSSPDAFEQPPLPPLSAIPVAHPGCCLALSVPLLAYLDSLIPAPPSIVLSVGSGYGLLEALLLSQPGSPNIIGIEVQPSSNRYLPPAHHRIVSGTRFLEPIAEMAAAWMFVYPKRVGLVEEYLDVCGGGRVELILWAGPRADWEDYKGCFEGARDGIRWDLDTKSADDVGGRTWEFIAVARKRHDAPTDT